MTLEILAATTAGLLLVTWWLHRSTMLPATTRQRRARTRDTASSFQHPLLMAAPTDTATTGSTTTPDSAPGTSARAARKPPKRKQPGPNRRQFLKWGMGLGWLGVLAGFGTASLAFIWPNLRGGFGAQIPVGTEDGILGEIDANEGRFELPEARTLMVKYDASQDPTGQYAEITGQTNLMALYQKCVHLGCKVPWCAASQWWECPCHGSKYNRWGEWQEGPAPRGLDRFAVANVDGQVVIDTGTIITGPSRSAAVLNQPAEGPHCQ
jgi:cytochrome b6-f complex iron-sulfur subunit